MKVFSELLTSCNRGTKARVLTYETVSSAAFGDLPINLRL